MLTWRLVIVKDWGAEMWELLLEHARLSFSLLDDRYISVGVIRVGLRRTRNRAYVPPTSSFALLKHAHSLGVGVIPAYRYKQ